MKYTNEWHSPRLYRTHIHYRGLTVEAGQPRTHCVGGVPSRWVVELVEKTPIHTHTEPCNNAYRKGAIWKNPGYSLWRVGLRLHRFLSLDYMSAQWKPYTPTYATASTVENKRYFTDVKRQLFYIMYGFKHAVHVVFFGRVPSIPLTSSTATKQAIIVFCACFGEKYFLFWVKSLFDVAHKFQGCGARLIEYRWASTRLCPPVPLQSTDNILCQGSC